MPDHTRVPSFLSPCQTPCGRHRSSHCTRPRMGAIASLIAPCHAWVPSLYSPPQTSCGHHYSTHHVRPRAGAGFAPPRAKQGTSWFVPAYGRAARAIRATQINDPPEGNDPLEGGVVELSLLMGGFEAIFRRLLPHCFPLAPKIPGQEFDVVFSYYSEMAKPSHKCP